MVLNIYSIYDLAAKAYVTPFFMNNDAMAIRAFKQTVNDSNSAIFKDPTQFSLFRIGTFNDSTSFIHTDAPELLASATELIESEVNIDLEMYVKRFKDLDEEIKAIKEGILYTNNTINTYVMKSSVSNKVSFFDKFKRK